MSVILVYLKDVAAFDESGFYKWLADNGQFYHNEVQINMQGLEIIQRQCFRNSQLAFYVRGMDYIEGMYVANGLQLPLDHAWNAVNKMTVDLTTAKFGFTVQERFGIKVPDAFMHEYFESDQILTPLKSYYFKKIMRK